MIADDLLVVAEALARPNADLPREAAIRRSISTAYYALFHGVAELCADDLVGRDRSEWPAWQRTYRALDHSAAKAYLERIGKTSTDSDLVLLADAFVQLQRLRHEADYDPLRVYSDSEMLEYLRVSQSGLDALRRLGPEARKELTTSLLLRARR